MKGMPTTSWFEVSDVNALHSSAKLMTFVTAVLLLIEKYSNFVCMFLPF